jgi:hypothetical protein
VLQHVVKYALESAAGFNRLTRTGFSHKKGVNALADQWLSQPRRKRRGYAKTIQTKVFLNFVKNGQKRPITLTNAGIYIFHMYPEKCLKNVNETFLR